MARTKAQANRGRGSNLSRTARAKGGRNSHKSTIGKVLNASPINLEKIGDTRVIARKMRKNSVGLYLLGGVGSFFLGRYLLQYYKNHPEIAGFVRDNFENVGDKFREFRGVEEQEGSEARH